MSDLLTFGLVMILLSIGLIMDEDGFRKIIGWMIMGGTLFISSILLFLQLMGMK